MKKRCLNAKRADFKNYGGRGITIQACWMTFTHFLLDMGVRPPGTTLDRKDNDAGYTRSNCRWATVAQQQANRRNSLTFNRRIEREKQKPSFTTRKHKHGQGRHGKRTPEYMAWNSMMRRCYSVTDRDYPQVGGRGITVCKAWREFAMFFAQVGKRPSKHQLRRLDQDKDFTPENCMWMPA